MATLVQAVRMAFHYGEEHLGVTDIFGEDVGPPLVGVFTATQGLTAWNATNYPHSVRETIEQDTLYEISI